MALSNGNYVVRSFTWSGNKGAVTCGNGATGATVGAVSSSNSLAGTAGSDRIGSSGVVALSNGNYVVRSSSWGGNKGAVTWGNGATGATVGTVSSANSLVGAVITDRIGLGTVMELGSGNYVVVSTNWSATKGAVTWGSGTAGVSGELSSANSLVASTNGSGLAFRPRATATMSSSHHPGTI